MDLLLFEVTIAVGVCGTLSIRASQGLRATFAASLRFYYADDYQQYLAKHVNGYRCHANTGVPFPIDS